MRLSVCCFFGNPVSASSDFDSSNSSRPILEGYILYAQQAQMTRKHVHAELQNLKRLFVGRLEMVELSFTYVYCFGGRTSCSFFAYEKSSLARCAIGSEMSSGRFLARSSILQFAVHSTCQSSTRSIRRCGTGLLLAPFCPSIFLVVTTSWSSISLYDCTAQWQNSTTGGR